MLRSVILSILLIFSVQQAVFAQSGKDKVHPRAQKFFDQGIDLIRARKFTDAAEMLRKAIDKDPNFPEAYFALSGISSATGKKKEAYSYFKTGIEMAPFSPARQNDYLSFAEMSMIYGEYELARKYYQNYLKTNPQKKEQVLSAEQQLRNIDFAINAMNNPVPFNPVRLNDKINSFALQYFPAVTADNRFFLYTARKGTRAQHDEDLYVSVKQGDDWGAPQSISAAINTRNNEGAASISGDGKTLVYSSCNRKDSFGNCDLYISRRTGNEWSPPKNLGKNVNSEAWDSQPSLSADGRTLYFSSNRPGGSGMEDIWVSTLLNNGEWSEPRNLGPTVNTPLREMAPLIHASGTTLYLTSDGLQGMGGLDLFKTTLNKDKQWEQPVNLGYPINTSSDEASLFITTDNTKGYYSRQIDHEDNTVTIDLFEFDVPENLKSGEASTYAQGRVFDADTKKPIAASVQLYDIATDELEQQVESDPTYGDYTIVLTEGAQYALYVTADNYLMESLSFDYTDKKEFDPLTLDVYLKPIKSGASIVLNNLFFDTGKYTLEDKSKTELNKLIGFMQQNKAVTIEISGHTDDVGSDQANQVLSEKRAQSVMDYLVKIGISKSRIRHKGFGETKPVQPNDSEENRRQNRRIELRVL